MILKSSGKVFVLLKIKSRRYQVPHHVSSQLFIVGVDSIHPLKKMVEYNKKNQHTGTFCGKMNFFDWGLK